LEFQKNYLNGPKHNQISIKISNQIYFEVNPFEVIPSCGFTFRWDERGGGGVARGVTVEVITHLPLNTKESRGQQKKKFICVTTDEKTFNNTDKEIFI